MSIKTKFILIILIILIIGFSAALIINESTITSNTKQLTQEKLKEMCNTYIEKFDTYTDIQQSTGKSIATAGENIYKIYSKNKTSVDQELQDVLLSNIKDNPTVSGGGIWFEQNLINGYEYFAPYAYWWPVENEETGEIELKAFLDLETYMNSNYTIEEWYTTTIPKDWDRTQKPENEVTISDPYLYLLPDQTFDDVEDVLATTYITVNTVMMPDNKIVGLASSDITLQFIPSLVKDFFITENSEIFFIDPSTKRHLYNKKKELIFRPYTKKFSPIYEGEKLVEEAITPWIDQLNLDISNNEIGIVENLKINNETNTLYYGKTDYGYIFGFIVPDKEAYKSLFALRNRFRLTMIIVAIIVIFILYFLISGIVKPIETASAKLHQISEGSGDLTSQLTVKSKDEIGILAKSFNNFTNKLSEIILKIKKSVSNTNRNSDELAANSEEISSAIQEVNATTTSLTSKVDSLNEQMKNSKDAMSNLKDYNKKVLSLIESQSNASSESFSAIEQLLASIQNITNIANQKKELSDSLIKQANEGNENMQQTLNSIKSISNSAKVINDMIKVINDVAEKTNLLAMNAAIEAAHAGEAGAGFAVVADEIRKLADTTATNAKNISNSLEKIIEDINHSEDITYKTNASINSVIEGIGELANAMTEMVTAMNESAEASNHINSTLKNLLKISESVKSSSSDMTLNLDSIDTSLDSISDLSEENVIGLKEISTSMQEISLAINNLAKLSSDNSNNMNELTSEIDQFKTDNNS